MLNTYNIASREPCSNIEEENKSYKKCLYGEFCYNLQNSSYIYIGFNIKSFKESALGRFFHRVAMSVSLSICPLPMRFFCRPLIGSQVT